jgi:hypothetical protein
MGKGHCMGNIGMAASTASFVSKLFLEISKVSNQGLYNTVRLSHKHRYSKIFIKTRASLNLLDFINCLDQTSDKLSDHAILQAVAYAEVMKNAQFILKISDNALRSLRGKPSSRNKNNRWRYGTIKDRAERILKELQTSIRPS